MEDTATSGGMFGNMDSSRRKNISDQPLRAGGPDHHTSPTSLGLRSEWGGGVRVTWGLRAPLVLVVVEPQAAKRCQFPKVFDSGSGSKVIVLGIEGNNHLVRSLGPTVERTDCSPSP